MSESFCVGEPDVIMCGLTTYPGYGMKSYIVYIKREKGKNEIHVNTHFNVKNGVYKCMVYYDRKLCDTVEQFGKITVAEIESQVYGAYMDGAR